MKARANITQTRSTLLLAWFTLMTFQPSALATEDVPFKGFAVGAITGMTPGPDGVTITALAVGHATQLGQFAREETLLLNPLTLSITGTIVFTAANGDQLMVTVTGAFTSPTTAAGTYTLNGGTGRFANAVGDAAFLASMDGGLVTITFSGAISSVGPKPPAS